MDGAYANVVTFVQHLAPEWRKSQQEGLARLMLALVERPTLCLSELARAYPDGPGARPRSALHGRLKRLGRFLDNPRLQEEALWRRLYLLSLHFGDDWAPTGVPEGVLPLLLDTTYFEPFAAVTVAVPCGSRGLTIALSTYERHRLLACGIQAPARPRYYDSQNQIEEELLQLVYSWLAPAMKAVLVADAGFARASLFGQLLEHERAFVIRFDADTHVTLPDGQTGAVQALVALSEGQSRFIPHAYYGKEAKIPVAVLALWEAGQEEPWYLASSLADPQLIGCLYHWRMRIEAGYRDGKSGVICRQGGDAHRLESVLHLHRLLTACFCLHWLTALVGLQAYTDLPAGRNCQSGSPLETAPPDSQLSSEIARGAPALPPHPSPHRGPSQPLPAWMKRFAVRGPLSFVRLGLEVLRLPDLLAIVCRLVHWIGIWLWPYAPPWTSRQLAYRRSHWWPAPAS